MPRVTAVLTSHLAGQDLAAAVGSVFNQSYTDWELLFVDDGNSDETRSIVRSYAAALGNKLRCLYQSNRSPSAARNLGIRQARGEFLAFLDASETWSPRYLERSVACLERDPAAGLVHSRMAKLDARGDTVDCAVLPGRYLAGNIACHILTGRAQIFRPTVLLRKCALDQVGMFDESMPSCEERDLWFRIARRRTVSYLDEVLAQSAIAADDHPERAAAGQLSFVYKYYEKGACSRAELHEALGRVYREYGDALFASAQVPQAIPLFGRAVVYAPLAPGNARMLLTAISGSFLEAVRTYLIAPGRRRVL